MDDDSAVPNAQDEESAVLVFEATVQEAMDAVYTCKCCKRNTPDCSVFYSASFLLTRIPNCSKLLKAVY